MLNIMCKTYYILLGLHYKDNGGMIKYRKIPSIMPEDLNAASIILGSKMWS